MANSDFSEDCTGWLVVLGSHICTLFVFGVYQAFGPLFVAIQIHFDASSAQTSWILALFLFIEMGFGPFSNVIVKKIGFRLTVMIGTLLSTVGFFLSAFAPKLEFLYFSIGILVGLGYGLIVAPGFGIVAHVFKRRYVLAISLASMGAGIGILIFPPLLQKLIDVYGWRGASILFAGMNAHMFISAALFGLPEHLKTTERENQSEGECEQETEDTEKKPKFRNWKMVIAACDCVIFTKHPCFVVFLIASLFGVGAGIFGAPAHMLARAESQNLASLNDIALIVSITGVGSVLGRLSPPVVSCCDRFGMTSSKWFGLMLLLVGVLNTLTYFVRSFAAYSVYAFLLGHFTGFIYTLAPQVAMDILSAKMVVAGLGLYSFFTGVGGLFGPPCAGLIYDLTGSYDNSFYFYGSLSVFGGLILLLIGPLVTHKQQNKHLDGEVGHIEGDELFVGDIQMHYSNVATQTG